VDGRGRCSMVVHHAQLPTVISELMSSPSPSHFCSIDSRSLAVLRLQRSARCLSTCTRRTSHSPSSDLVVLLNAWLVEGVLILRCAEARGGVLTNTLVSQSCLVTVSVSVFLCVCPSLAHICCSSSSNEARDVERERESEGGSQVATLILAAAWVCS